MTRPCAVCGGAGFAPLATDNGYDWETCQSCGFVRVDHEFSVAEAQAAEVEDAAPWYIATYKAKYASKLARSRRRAKRMKARAPGKRFLDVGSNYGFMVQAAAELGFEATGVEMSGPLVTAARQAFPERSFREGPLEAQQWGTERFDCVYCSEVIEHTADPRVFLKDIAAVMAPGAILYMTTPHLREVRRMGFKGLAAPAHKMYFTETTLNRLALDCGFDRVRQEFTFFRGLKMWAVRA